MELSPTARLILGMISKGTRTGYDIKRVADRSTRFFWAVSYGQIYPELKRLEEAGLIEGEASPNGARQRTAYSLTAAGRKALEQWLLSSEELGFELRDDALVRLFFADALPLEERLRLLRQMRQRHEAIVERLEQIRPDAERLSAQMPAVTLDYGLDQHRASVKWCRRMEEQLASSGTKRRPKAARR